jgi:hypothetical protein
VNTSRIPVRPSCCLRLQQRLDGAPLVRGAIALGDLRERKHQVEHLSRIDRAVEDEIDQLRQVLANRRRAAVQMDPTSVPSASGTRMHGACAPTTGSKR